VIYGLYNHTRKEYVQPGPLPVDGEDPVRYPFSAFIVNLLVNSWRHDHEVILDDSRDFDCDFELAKKYKDRSVELWNECVTMYETELSGLMKIEG
jgi:hypothetical protein